MRPVDTLILGSVIAAATCSAACSRESKTHGPQPTTASSPEPNTPAPQPTATHETKGKMTSIGTATMKPDGTIVLDLYTGGSGGPRGQARFTYAPNHPKYAETLAHVGGLEPGESKSVPPWPDDIDDDRVDQTVNAYVHDKKGWRRDAYSVQIVGTDAEKNIAVTVAHVDDRKARGSGTRKSFALRIDPKTYEVVREIAIP